MNLLSNYEDWGSLFLLNFWIQPEDYTVQQPRRSISRYDYYYYYYIIVVGCYMQYILP
jgi:hypothetical protein